MSYINISSLQKSHYKIQIIRIILSVNLHNPITKRKRNYFYINHEINKMIIDT